MEHNYWYQGVPSSESVLKIDRRVTRHNCSLTLTLTLTRSVMQCCKQCPYLCENVGRFPNRYPFSKDDVTYSVPLQMDVSLK